MGRFSRKKDESPPVIDLREPNANKAKWGSPVPCPREHPSEVASSGTSSAPSLTSRPPRRRKRP